MRRVVACLAALVLAGTALALSYAPQSPHRWEMKSESGGAMLVSLPDEQGRVVRLLVYDVDPAAGGMDEWLDARLSALAQGSRSKLRRSNNFWAWDAEAQIDGLPKFMVTAYAYNTVGGFQMLALLRPDAVSADDARVRLTADYVRGRLKDGLAFRQGVWFKPEPMPDIESGLDCRIEQRIAFIWTLGAKCEEGKGCDVVPAITKELVEQEVCR